MITLPIYYVKTWGESTLNSHNEKNCKWEVDIKYESKVTLFFAKGRKQESSYRLKWNSNFSEQLAKDYPKSFVRALEFHMGALLFS